jgi:hypothetical protein
MATFHVYCDKNHSHVSHVSHVTSKTRRDDVYDERRRDDLWSLFRLMDFHSSDLPVAVVGA